MSYIIFLPLILSYLIGSFPTALIIGKWVKGIDVREHGSKNMGATNVFRLLGKKWGILTLLIDVFKGFLAANMVSIFKLSLANDPFLLKILAGTIALIGHVYPIFAKLKGGKGVAITLGMSFALNITGTLYLVILFAVLMGLTRTVSISVLISGVFYSVFISSFFSENSLYLHLYSVILYLFMVYTHRQNIKRIINKQEKKLF